VWPIFDIYLSCTPIDLNCRAVLVIDSIKISKTKLTRCKGSPNVDYIDFEDLASRILRASIKGIFQR
jgi:hypothetical protein